MKKTFLLSLMLLLFASTTFSQDILKGSKIEWQDLEETLALEQDRNLFIFIYADWCEYCQKTAETLLENEEFINIINNDFIPVKINANSYETISILNTDFEYDNESGYHSLPIILLEGQMNLPSFVFRGPKFERITEVSGYQDDVESFKKYLKYIATNAYQTTTWGEYYHKQ